MIFGISYLEWAANLTTALCIFLAGRNNIHTWWTGIVACVLFGALFFQSQLYADVTLQVFFIATGIIGWYGWTNKAEKAELPLAYASRSTMTWMIVAAVIVAGLYGTLLHYYTNAYAPWIDSTVLTFSVFAQLLLMRRNVQTWPLWVLVNVLSVPLYFSRELYLTAGLYAIFLVHAIWAWHNWVKLARDIFKVGDEVFMSFVPNTLTRGLPQETVDAIMGSEEMKVIEKLSTGKLLVSFTDIRGKYHALAVEPQYLTAA